MNELTVAVLHDDCKVLSPFFIVFKGIDVLYDVLIVVLLKTFSLILLQLGKRRVCIDFDDEILTVGKPFDKQRFPLHALSQLFLPLVESRPFVELRHILIILITL